MIRDLARRAFYAGAPRWLVDWRLRTYLHNRGSELLALSDPDADISEQISLLWRFSDFRPLQKESEIATLVNRYRSLAPRTVLEIGSAGGGTTYLFAKNAPDDAHLISLDLSFGTTRQGIIERFARGQQRISCIAADSHSATAFQQVSALLEDHAIDFLFIDGDHSYEGVGEDFRRFSPLVRAGGMIVFHDIVPDYGTRFGTATSSDTGGVPLFWKEMKGLYPLHEEIIESNEQDGYGLGLLVWPGALRG